MSFRAEKAASGLIHTQRNRDGWRTDDEMWYLERLGLHKYPVTHWPRIFDRPAVFNMRSDLMVSYESNMHKRDRWELIDYRLVKEYVNYENNRLIDTAVAFDMPIVDLMDVTAPYSKVKAYLTPSQREQLNGTYK